MRSMGLEVRCGDGRSSVPGKGDSGPQWPVTQRGMSCLDRKLPRERGCGSVRLRPRASIRLPRAGWTWPGTGCRCGPIPRRSRTWPRCGTGWRIATATSSTSSPDPAPRRQARKRQEGGRSQAPSPGPQESCGYSLFGSQAAPFTALFATWTVPDLRYSHDPYGPDYFRTFVSLGFLDIHTEMSVESPNYGRS